MADQKDNSASLPSPHGDKLRALLSNSKLPAADKDRVSAAIERYNAWIEGLKGTEGEMDAVIDEMVAGVTAYKKTVDLDLVFDSPEDFLYRQKGQLKLDNTVIEEFLPWLITKSLAGRIKDADILVGPANCFSHLRFETELKNPKPGGGMTIRSKNQDFAVARRIFLKSSHYDDFREPAQSQSCLAFVAAEIKTNLDKTMFQEAAATAQDVRISVPGARYFLLVEWLDMTPISASATAIEEVILLRKAKRLAANVREAFSVAEGRKKNRESFERHLNENPFSTDAFRRFVRHVEGLFRDDDAVESEVLARGFF